MKLSLREEICNAAVRLARAAGYVGAGTVEFLLDRKGSFYFIEANARLQVEHPVTEMITGVDIVKASILIAAGEPLPFRQREVKVDGHAMECRINAEDWSRNFMPSAGRIDLWELPGGPGVRVDSHVVPGYSVPPTYDSMIGKLIVHAEDRQACMTRMAGALREFRVGPIKTTIGLHLRLMEHSDFRNGGVDIHFLERLLK